MEDALALGEIEQLVLVEFAPAVKIKVVTVGMSARGVVVAGLYLLVAYGADGESPERVALIGEQVFADLHGHSPFLLFFYLVSVCKSSEKLDNTKI